MANAFVNTAGDVTSRLTDYIVAARWSDLPANVRHEALRSFFNILGCTIGGARHAVVEIADNTLGEYAGAPHATVIGRGHKADALHACLINTLSSSIYSYDDTHAEAVVHPSGPVAVGGAGVSRKAPDKRRGFPAGIRAWRRNDLPTVESDLRAAGAMGQLPGRRPALPRASVQQSRPPSCCVWMRRGCNMPSALRCRRRRVSASCTRRWFRR